MTAVQFLFAAVGVVLVLILLSRFMKSPAQSLFRLVRGLLLGTLGLWFLNTIGSGIHLHVPFNPITIGVTGILGIPGLIGLLVLQTWIIK